MKYIINYFGCIWLLLCFGLSVYAVFETIQGSAWCVLFIALSMLLLAVFIYTLVDAIIAQVNGAKKKNAGKT